MVTSENLVTGEQIAGKHDPLIPKT